MAKTRNLKLKTEHCLFSVMRRKKIFGFGLKLLAGVILLLSRAAFTEEVKGTGEEAAKSVIESVVVAGNVSIDGKDVLSKVHSRAGELFDANTAAQDVKRIAELPGVEYSYYNTAVAEDKIKLTFIVVEKNLARSITFVGNRSYNDKTLMKKLDFKVGDYLDPVLAETGRKSIFDFYTGKGYPFVVVTIDQAGLSSGKLVYTIDEGPKVQIASVGFVGNSDLKTRELKKVIKASTRKWVFWRGYYTEEEITGDVAKLQQCYQKRGHLNAIINAKKEFNQNKDKVRIIYEIYEGPVYTVDKINITGAEFFDQAKLRSELKMQEGKVYNEEKANSDAKQMLKLYRESGFIDARVERERKFVSGNTVDVNYAVTEGGRFRIGMINIAGNELTQDKVIRRVLDEYDFQPGGWYNADTARGDGTGRLEKLVGRATMAEHGTSYITPTGDKPDQKDAHVSIVEGQTGMVMLGAGIASDSGIIGQLVFDQKNFDIKDTPKSFDDLITGKAFRGAGQDLRIALQPGTKVSEYSVSFTEPYLNNKPISLDVAGSSWERGRESYIEQRTKGYVGFEKRYPDYWRRSLGFRVEDVSVKDVDVDAPKEIKDVEGGNLLAGVRLGVGREVVDDSLNPTKGYGFNVGYEQVGGDYTFGILSGTHRHYTTLYTDLAERKTILATKLLAATTVGEAPPFEKFYAGGSGAYGIRGFEYRGVSTRGLPTLPNTSTIRDDPIGSNWIFLASAEVVHPLIGDNFSALFFIDSGTIDSGGYRVSVGMGIQILLPQVFGPVPMRFELAAPLMKDDADQTQMFSFSIGRLF